MAAPTRSFSRKPAGITHEQIVRDVRAGNIKPVYYLMGDEAYYIDRVADFIVDSLLKPEERDFNLVTLFGADTDIDTIITSAKAFPMGADHLVIVVKEAQNLKHIERLELYLRQMQPSTVLIFCHKNGSLDRRLKVAQQIVKVGVVYESKKLYDNKLPGFVTDYLRRRRIAAAPGAAEMVAELVGSDLNRIASELDKLILALPSGSKSVTPELVRQQIGLSKNFNIFELQDALGVKDVLKVNQIMKYFDSNPKENPVQLVLPSLFKFFTNLMLAFYAPNRTEPAIASWLGMSDWQVRKNVLPGMQRYTAVKVMHILSEIRRTDGRSKGVDNPAVSNGDLMKELMFFILH